MVECRETSVMTAVCPRTAMTLKEGDEIVFLLPEPDSTYLSVPANTFCYWRVSNPKLATVTISITRERVLLSIDPG